MQEQDIQLAARCARLAEQSRHAATWLADNRETVGSECTTLQKEMRRAARFFGKCEQAARRKMCVGVFGPSQSGKSYLISALARDSRGDLLADFCGRTSDFITEINPEGGKESTGLVTRFTTTPPQGLTPDFPIRLRLLSEMDVVRVLANTYYADCEHKQMPDADAMRSALERLTQTARQSSPGASSVTADDVEDLREYLNRNFLSKPRVQMLQQGYWAQAVSLAPLLPLSYRAELFGIIWNNQPKFQQLFLELCQALEALGNPAEADCPLEALLPRQTSIIDVALLAGLGTHSAEDRLTLLGKDGRKAALPRAVVTALTAEITIFMREQPDDFFSYTDLLDFPGYRSRLKILDLDKELEREGALQNLFLRGKVAYLFERYKTDLELTSMLLCIGPSNQEVQDLPAVINDWVSDAAGKTPELRQGRHTTLFLVLTKFDMEFEKKKGAVDDETRWSNRLHASLLDFFGKQHDWPEQWTPDQPFNNTYWLRNPKFRWEAVIAFDGDRETGIRPEQEAYVSDMKAKFLNTPEVRRHFADPEAAWNAAFTLNDGGVAFLRRQLRPVCDPAIKRRQVADRVADNLRPFVEHLRRFHRIDDKAALREQQRQLGMRLARSLALTAQNQRFGELLRAMLMRDHELYALYYQVENRLMRENEQAPVPQPSVGSAASAQDIMDDLFGDMAPPVPASAETPEAAPQPLDEAGAFAELVVGAWIEQLNAFAADPVRQRYFGLEAEDFGQLVHEIIQGMSRLDLEKDMAQAVRDVSGYRNIRRDKLIWRQASMAAYCISAFVDWLGFNPASVPEAKRTIQLAGRTRTLFGQQPDPEGYPALAAEPLAFDRQYYTDWLAALMHLIEGNADYEGGQTFDPEQNARLGRLINNLNPSVFTQDN